MSLFDPLGYLTELPLRLWRADRRPEAHRFLLGCIGVTIVLAIQGALLLWVLYPDHPWT